MALEGAQGSGLKELRTKYLENDVGWDALPALLGRRKKSIPRYIMGR